MTEKLNLINSAEVLNDIAETLRFRATIFFRSQLAAPWGIALSDMAWPRFHISLGGSFFANIENRKNADPLAIGERGVVMLPAGGSHWIADAPGRRLVSDTEAGEACQLNKPLFQAGEITHSVMCGIVKFDTNASHPLLHCLPEIIHIPEVPRESRAWRLIEMIDDELNENWPLANATVDRLTEVLFITLLHEFIETHQEAVGFILALRDRRLNHIIQLIHRNLAEPWTIEGLAKQVGMSRATLIRQFQEAIGSTPIEYLTQWRLLRAHYLIKHTYDSIEAIAAQVGYASAQTLSKSFKKRYGHPPAELRKAM
ncbi:MAG: AraC family transcriptional regulator [Pseudomonadota bacterium]